MIPAQLTQLANMANLQNLLEWLPLGNPDQQLKAAESCYEKGDYARSFEKAQKLTTQHTNRLDAWFLLGLSADKLGNNAQAIQAFKRALTISPTNLDTLYNIARQYIIQGDPSSALGYIEMAETVMDSKSPDLDILYLKATTLEDLQEKELAKEVYQELVKLNPGHVGRKFLAELCVEAGEISSGVKHLKAYVEGHPEDLDGIFYYALQLGKLEKWHDVVENCQLVIKNCPERADAYNQLGLAYYCQDSYEQALESYLKALAIEKDYSLALNNLGYTYAKLGNYAKALETFETYIGFLSPISEDYHEIQSQIETIKQKILEEAADEATT